MTAKEGSRDFCTVLDIIAKDGNFDDYVKAIHMACLSSVLTTKHNRIALIPPERKGLAKKDPTEPLRQLIIPYIRGFKRDQPFNEETALVDGTQLIAIEASAGYEITGSGAKAKIGGAKIKRILHAKNGFAIVLDSNPEISEPKIAKKQEGGGYEGGVFTIDFGSDGRAALYLQTLNGPDLRNAIITVYKRMFSVGWYNQFTSAFLMYMRYNDALFRTYTGGISPYLYYYRTLILPSPKVSVGAILMPYLRQRTYLIPDLLLLNFVKSSWWCYSNPSLSTISKFYIQYGGGCGAISGGRRGGAGKTEAECLKEAIDYANGILESDQEDPIKEMGKQQADYVIEIMKYADGKYTALDQAALDQDLGVLSSDKWKAEVYVRLLHHLSKNGDKHTPEQRKIIVENYLRSFDDALTAINGLTTENFKIFIENIIKTLKNHLGKLTDNGAITDEGFNRHKINENVVDLLNSQAVSNPNWKK